MDGSDIATVIAASVTGTFALLAIVMPIVLGRQSAKKARENETHLPHLPSESDAVMDCVHRLRRELHLRLDDVECLVRRRSCPFSDPVVTEERRALIDLMKAP